MSDDELELELELEDDESEAEYFTVNIFRRPVFTILTTSENYVNMWITQYIHYPNCDPKKLRRRLLRPVVGLDIELVNPDHPYPPIATIQLCVEGQVLIYHMYNSTTLPTALELFITDPNNTFVGVNLQRKLWLLKTETRHSGRIPYRDLGFLAARRYGRPELVNAHMSELAWIVLGNLLVMPEVNPDWGIPVLLNEQVVHACVGAYVSYEMGRVLC